MKRKVVSVSSGVTCIFEKEKENLKCFAYENGVQLTGIEVSDVLDISASAVSQITKKGLSTFYRKLRYKNKSLSPIEILALMIEMFGIKTEWQYYKFFSLFHRNVKGEIRKDARKKYKY